MAQLTLNITMSLDGFIAGPNQTLDKPLGEGGERFIRPGQELLDSRRLRSSDELGR